MNVYLAVLAALVFAVVATRSARIRAAIAGLLTVGCVVGAASLGLLVLPVAIIVWLLAANAEVRARVARAR